jgi:glycosyltransferase involved in cell wall biosynthesis
MTGPIARELVGTKVCLIGDIKGNMDEGMKITIMRYYEKLSEENDVLLLNGKSGASREFWGDLLRFKPQIIHYVAGPTPLSFIVLKILSARCRGSKTVISASHPLRTRFFPFVVPMYRPDVILVQSDATEQLFAGLGCETAYLPSAVDSSKFVPVSRSRKNTLRVQYGLPTEKFVVLHVGNLNRGRNAQALKSLQSEKTQVLAVSSTSVPEDKGVRLELEQAGCIVLSTFNDRIEEVYQLSDCYVFPVPPAHTFNSIQMPLSVLEAMACNLPVITTRYGGLPKAFRSEDGLVFVDDQTTLAEAVDWVSRCSEIRTREKIALYSWDSVVGDLMTIYASLLAG